MHPNHGIIFVMSPFLQFDIALVILILFAKLGGYISYRLGQPSVLGELLVGIVIGPSLINVLDLPFFTDPHLHETIAHLAEVGVLLLMFLAGLELHINDLAKTGRVSVLAGTLGVLFPMLLGTGLGLAFSMELRQRHFHRIGALGHQRQHLGPNLDGAGFPAQPGGREPAGGGRLR